MEDGPALRRIIPTLDETIEPSEAPAAAGRRRDRRWPAIFSLLAAVMGMMIGFNLLIAWGRAVLHLRSTVPDYIPILAVFTAITGFLFWKVVVAMQRRAVEQGRVRCASHHVRGIIENFVELDRRTIKQSGPDRTEIDYRLDLHLIDPPFAGFKASTKWTSRRGTAPRPGSVEDLLVGTRESEDGEPRPLVHGLLSDFRESYGGAFPFFVFIGLIALGMSIAVQHFAVFP
ncbi:hypothetical protein [Fulvimarina sp. MAC8]|uniref:hypothetical protein n=1 Tax=Fulvimarina sp. MAC8 TaxID=3162874 RepID=UPI0032ED1ACE